MDERLRKWLDLELSEYMKLVAQYKQKVFRRAPLWMAVSIGGMVGLGIVVGYDIGYVMRLHFVIGLIIALFIGLGFWLQGCCGMSAGKIRKIYEKGIQSFFVRPEDTEAFCKQMESGNYGKVEFLNTMSDKYPTRFLAGPDYWVFVNGRGRCDFFKTANIQSVFGREETTRVNTGNSIAGRKMTIGVSMVLVYGGNSSEVSLTKEVTEKELFFQNGAQFQAAMDIIGMYCPQSRQWK